MAAQKNQQQRSNKPAHLVRKGALSVSIWAREHEGNTFYSCTASRAYTQDNGATWEYSDSFGSDELLTVAELFRVAWQWIRHADERGPQ